MALQINNNQNQH